MVVPYPKRTNERASEAKNAKSRYETTQNKKTEPQRLLIPSRPPARPSARSPARQPAERATGRTASRAAQSSKLSVCLSVCLSVFLDWYLRRDARGEQVVIGARNPDAKVALEVHTEAWIHEFGEPVSPSRRRTICQLFETSERASERARGIRPPEMYC